MNSRTEQLLFCDGSDHDRLQAAVILRAVTYSETLLPVSCDPGGRIVAPSSAASTANGRSAGGPGTPRASIDDDRIEVDDRAGVPAGEKRLYLQGAHGILRSLTERYAAWDRPEFQPILTGATGSRPHGQFVDGSLIYGDYYYIEAFAKLAGWGRRIY